MKIIFPVSRTQWSEFQRLQKCLDLSPDQVVEQAFTVLSWVVKEKQEGRTVMGFQEHPPTVDLLGMPALNRVHSGDVVDATPLSQLPQLIAEEILSLVKEGHIEEAMEAAKVGKRLDRAGPFPPFEPPNDPKRVQSTMILEAAKVMAEEGEPSTAVQLVKEVRKPKPHETHEP